MKPRKRTDTGYPITATLLSNGVPVDLSGSTVTISLRDRLTGAIKVNEAGCSLTNPTGGQVSYQPIAADVDTSGSYDVEFKQIRPNATIIHYPSDGYEPLTIEDNLG